MYDLLPGFSSKPNILILMVDEERFPPVYENEAVRSWREQNLVAHRLLRSHGLEFNRHYTGSAACCPSRATLFTGQYPSLHGVTQTTEAAKKSFDNDMFWLDPNTVPTMGDYFREAGYRTYYKGKWHVSDADILIPGTHVGITSYDPETGVPSPDRVELYLQADRLESFGFSGWVGPEPHGVEPHKSGSSAAIGLSGRDEVFADEAAELIRRLDRAKTDHPEPWLMVVSFVNPHDIALYGLYSSFVPLFRFAVDDSVPPIPPPPTQHESLRTKPRCQSSYRDLFPRIFQPIYDDPFYRRLYYQLQRNADQQMLRVFEALRQSSLYENTIVLFTSDHGEMLGAHGNMHQKWYSAYEEAIHVPFIIHNPHLFPSAKQMNMLTSHVDIIPTLLGLAGISAAEVQNKLRRTHSEVRPLVGRDLSEQLLGQGLPIRANEPLYFMTDDDISRGQHQVGVNRVPYPSVVQPNHVESVIADLDVGGRLESWKFSRYFDNPQFWSEPGVQDVIVTSHPVPSLKAGSTDGETASASVCTSTTKTRPVPDEFEMYNLSTDPLEIWNLANPEYATPQTVAIQQLLAQMLAEQRRLKRLTPASAGQTMRSSS